MHYCTLLPCDKLGITMNRTVKNKITLENGHRLDCIENHHFDRFVVKNVHADIASDGGELNTKLSYMNSDN